MENLSNNTNSVTKEKVLQNQIISLKVEHDNLQKKILCLKLEFDILQEESNKKVRAINELGEFLAQEQAATLVASIAVKQTEDRIELSNSNHECEGCRYGYLNQEGHMGYGGCLSDDCLSDCGCLEESALEFE